MISAGIVSVSYIAATVLFILALSGLSSPETARRGNWFGIAGMAIALLATIFGVVTQQYATLLVALLIGVSLHKLPDDLRHHRWTRSCLSAAQISRLRVAIGYCPTYHLG